MQWLSQNWVWVVVLVAFIAMHMFGHGAHGGGCGGGHDQNRQKDESADDKRSSHQH